MRKFAVCFTPRSLCVVWLALILGVLFLTSLSVAQMRVDDADKDEEAEIDVLTTEEENTEDQASYLDALAAPVNLVVNANQDLPGLDTRIDLTSGDTLTITALGEASFGTESTQDCSISERTIPDGQRVTADGALCPPKIDPFAVLPSAPVGALIAKIGSSEWFAVGSRFSATIRSSGHLFLLYNDISGQYGNNSGIYQVTSTVEVSPPPPPPQECLPSPSGDTCARIDFNALLDGAPTSDPGLSFVAVDGLYSPLGVNFRSKDDAGPTFSHPLHPNSSQSIVINDVSRPQGGTFNIVAEFLTPTNFVSADVLSEADRSVRMTAKDASGAILGSTTSSSETISAFPFKGNVALSGIGAISTVEFEAVPDPAVAVVAIDNLTFSVVFEAAPVSEAASAPVPIPCQGKSCRVTIVCISADLAVPCNNAITVSVRRPRRSSVSETSGEVSDGRRAKAPLIIPFASGAASNIPPRQIASVKLKITKQGRRIAQSRVKKLRGVMSISNIVGSRTLSVPVRIKLK